MSNQPRILIVDDEPTALYTLEMLLMPEDYHIDFVTNGQAVFHHLDNHPLPDLILLDVMMPGMSGHEVCQQLKSCATTRQIPIVLVTALDRKEDLVRGLNAGADDFLTKPVSGPELRARVRSMLRMKSLYDELQEMIQIREEMTHLVVHDMRTPLSAVILYADMLADTVRKTATITSPKQAKMIQKLRDQALRLNDFLTDLLILGKMQSDKIVIERQTIALKNLFQSVVDAQQIIADAKQIQLQIDLPDTLPRIVLDSKLMRRALDNLVSNAIKFSPEESIVTLTARRIAATATSPAMFQLEVRDLGPGIPPEHQKTIFNRYEISYNKNHDDLQIGLGLYLCDLVVEAHGGRIYIRDNTPTGAKFIVELPA